MVQNAHLNYIFHDTCAIWFRLPPSKSIGFQGWVAQWSHFLVSSLFQAFTRCRVRVESRVRDGPLENLWGAGAGEVQKKIFAPVFAQGKIMKKTSCTPINPNKYACYGLKKIHTRNLITKKVPAARKFPSPPHPNNFSNGPSLSNHFMYCTMRGRGGGWGRGGKRRWINYNMDPSCFPLHTLHKSR